MTTTPSDALAEQARTLGLWGLIARWEEVRNEPWLEQVITIESAERARRSLERRLRSSRIGRFKPMADFDFAWPTKIDREQLDDLFTLSWLAAATNVVIVGPNGVGKTMIARNLAHQALLRGASTRVLTASELLNDLAAQDSSRAFQCRLRHWVRPGLLVIDELGYLSYDNRHADLLFEVVSARYGIKPIVLTTNKAFADWGEVFPNATSVVTLVDRLVHNSEILKIEGPSYRLKEAKEREARKAAERAARRRAK
jgi:DNA replication protein DnaC